MQGKKIIQKIWRFICPHDLYWVHDWEKELQDPLLVRCIDCKFEKWMPRGKVMKKKIPRDGEHPRNWIDKPSCDTDIRFPK